VEATRQILSEAESSLFGHTVFLILSLHKYSGFEKSKKLFVPHCSFWICFWMAWYGEGSGSGRQQSGHAWSFPEPGAAMLGWIRSE
ncbi:MAG: hypothetical protein VST68_08460, partial [Nitrospirota bacterium]|nr:hypothetical protein [Nitrospirota bacterium]